MIRSASRKSNLYEDLLKRISLKYLLIFLLLIYITFFNKRLLFLVIFEIFDVSKSIVKVKTGYLPIDLVFVFGVAVSYFFSPFLAIIIILLGMANRFIFGFFQPRHLIEIIRHLLIFFCVPFLRPYAFMNVGFIMLIVKYILKLVEVCILGDISVYERIISYYIVNFFGSLTLLYFLSIFSFFFY